jgi:hypothetical protein
VTGELDPADRRNSIITDIGFAPRNGTGKVDYETDIMILRPINLSRGNHKVWYELRQDKDPADRRWRSTLVA